MNLHDVQAVIDSAKARDNGRLEEFIRAVEPRASEKDVADAASVAVEVMETVPLLLAHAAYAAEQRGLNVVVMPLLEHAARYFINPIDLIPEMTQGLVGLLDDTYLALRILENLNRGADPLLEADFQEPLRFLRRLVGGTISRKLDAASIIALQDVSTEIGRAWSQMGRSS